MSISNLGKSKNLGRFSDINSVHEVEGSRYRINAVRARYKNIKEIHIQNVPKSRKLPVHFAKNGAFRICIKVSLSPVRLHRKS